MKRILTAAAVVTLCASASFAATSIVNSKHDLSSGNVTAGINIKSTTQGQICIFCHTPHNAVRNVPLWNRNDPSTAPSAYALYTSSATLTSVTKRAKLDSNSVSIFCLSCHDGTVSQIGSRVVNSGGNAMTMSGVWVAGGLTSDGKSLTNDHPIGFDYSAAQAQDPTGLNPTATASNTITGGSYPTKTIFYKSTAVTGADNTGNFMECASCHVVHDNTNKPFLRKDNAGSALCLACHIK